MTSSRPLPAAIIPPGALGQVICVGSHHPIEWVTPSDSGRRSRGSRAERVSMHRSLVLLVVVALIAPAEAPAAETPPVIYAHRGGAGIAPENTMGAFRQAH